MLRDIETDNIGAPSSIELMQEVQDMIGRQFFRAQGLVSHEEFELAKRIIPKVKKDFIQKHAQNKDEERELEEVWPFD